MAADSGPTTVGSIVAKARIDYDQWKADLAVIKQDAREIERLDPDIHIDTNAAEVVAKLGAAKAAAEAVAGGNEKVAAAQVRVTAAMSAAEIAQARVGVAQMRLNELREKGITSGSRYAAAELAVAAAQTAAAKASADAAEATNDHADATIRANEANRTSVTRVGAIVTAVALLVPLLAPVGAAVVGLGGAFLGLGAAGVFALFGIHAEMEKGTSTGQAYRAGLDTLHGAMSKLSQTAAVAMLSSFRRGVAEITGAMPQLNTQVGQFSSLLGQSGANALSGAINALRVLNPLFLTAGVYVRSLTEGFQEWTQGSGIEDFGGYALSMLPQVTEVLGKLAAMVIHILEALAPLGVVGMAVLTGIADVISAIPVDVLSQLIVTITWGAIAFKAWGFVAPMLANIATSMGAVGAATTIATGPIGWVVAGLAALAGIFAVVIANNSGATQAMQDYTYAVQQDTGAIGENIRAKTAQKLLDAGALDAAKKLGIATQVVVDATLGNADAQKTLTDALKIGTNGSKLQKDQLDKTGLGLVDYGLAVQTVKQAVDTNSIAIAGEIDRYKTLQGALESTTGATKAQQWADEAAAASLGISADAIAAAREGQDGLTDATAKATAEMYLQNDAAGLLRQTLDVLNGKTLSAAEAQNRFESQLVSMKDAIEQNGTALEGMDAGAIANRGSLLDLIQAAQDSAQAFRDQGGSAEETKAKLEASKQAIEDQAVANGMNRDSVHAYIDELFKIPAEIPKTKIEVDTATANAQIAAFLANVSSRVASIQVRATLPDLNGAASGSGRPGIAMGGTIPGLAGGGTGGTVVGPGTAGSDTAGLFRLGRGEEVTSNVFGQADRHRFTLKAINAGVTSMPGLGPSATSTTAPGQAAEVRPINVNVQVTVLKNEDPAVVGNQVGRGVREALAGVKV